MRVLVLSDEEGVRLRVTSGLRVRGGVDVVEATTALEAHRAVDEDGFDVLVLDGDLEPEGGFSVLYEIRQAGLLRGVETAPAVMLLGREQDRWLASWAGANRALQKPVDPFEVTRVLEEVLGQAAPEPAPVDESALGVEAAIEREEIRPS